MEGEAIAKKRVQTGNWYKMYEGGVKKKSSLIDEQ